MSNDSSTLKLKLNPVEKPLDLVPSTINARLVETSSFIRVVEARQRYQVSGAGLCVAVLDTGLRTTHTDFKGKVVAQYNLTKDNKKDPGNARDGYGHGTHVSGIIVANGINTGIAPGASILPVKILSNTGGGDFQTIEKGLEFVLNNYNKYNISVVNLSAGDSGNYQNEKPFLETNIAKYIQQLHQLNIPVIVSAGNSFYTHKSVQGMNFPAILRRCVSVGAIYDSKGNGFTYASGAAAAVTSPGQITPFSQRLHDSIGGVCRTDIFAPGAPITSSGIASDTAFSIQQGTSQAAPVVTGVIMLMQELYSQLTVGNNSKIELPGVNQLVEWIRESATSIVDGDDEQDNVINTGQTFKRIDAYEALRQIRKNFVQNLAFKQTR